MRPRITRTSFFAATFWIAGLALIAIDWSRATPHDRFAEPPPWQLGQQKTDGAAHCAAPLNLSSSAR